MDGTGGTLLDERMRQQLDRGERLIWSGMPKQGVMFRPSDAFAVPFSLMWGGFAIFWEASVLRIGTAPGFFVLWGIPFVAVGLYLIAGRFFYDAFCRARTLYGVTNQRALIISGIWQRNTQSIFLEGLTNINLREAGSGSGTITFGPEPSGFSWNAGGWPGANRNMSPRFEAIDEPRRVLDLIRNAQKTVNQQA